MAAAPYLKLGLALCLSVLTLTASGASVLERHHPVHPGRCPSCAALYPGGMPAPVPGEFNFYYLVRQWPNFFCKYQKPDQCYIEPDPSRGFTLHGLWPNLDNTCYEDFPEHCERNGDFEPYDRDSLSSATQQGLKENWISYTSGQDCFLAHEWGCHGTCSGLDQEAYFARVLQLHADHNLLDAMASANLQPSGDIAKNDLLDAFEAKFGQGVRPLLQCRKENGKSYLSEVWMCVTKDTFEVVPCKDVCQHCKPTKPCGDTVSFADDRFDTVQGPEPCKLGPCVAHMGTCNLP